MSSQKKKLLSELVECRWFIMNQLADEAEERGYIQEARGWRWLAKNKKWPGNRKGHKYGWLFKEPEFGNWEHYSHGLPEDLLDYGLVTTANLNLEYLLLDTARAVGQWIDHEELKELLDKRQLANEQEE